MNPVIRIISDILFKFDTIIDNLDKRIVQIIKQIFYIIFFIMLIFGIIIGYRYGKSAAVFNSTPLASSTNEVFTIDIKMEKEDGNFQSMLDTEMLAKRKDSILNKIRVPSNEKLEFDGTDRIVEPETTIKKIFPPPVFDIRERIVEIDSPDENPDEKQNKSEVNEIKRKPNKSVEKKNNDIMRIENNRILDLDTSKAAGRKKIMGKSYENGNYLNEKKAKKARVKKERVLHPIERSNILIEK